MAALPRIPRPPAELFGDDIAAASSPAAPDDPDRTRAARVADLLAWATSGIADLRLAAAAVLGAVVVAAVGWSILAGGGSPAEDRLPVATPALPTSTPGAAPVAQVGAEPGTAAPGGAASGASAGDDTGDGHDEPDGAPEEVVVHVAGAVLQPGLHHLASPARVQDAVAAAGGLAPDADGDRVNLAAPLADGARVYVPRVGVDVPPVDPSSVGGGGRADPASAASEGEPVEPVDLNTASATELEALPGVGPATAAAIVAHREQIGRFATVDELLDVRGIGEAKLAAVRDLVVVG